MPSFYAICPKGVFLSRSQGGAVLHSGPLSFYLLCYFLELLLFIFLLFSSLAHLLLFSLCVLWILSQGIIRAHFISSTNNSLLMGHEGPVSFVIFSLFALFTCVNNFHWPFVKNQIFQNSDKPMYNTNTYLLCPLWYFVSRMAEKAIDHQLPMTFFFHSTGASLITLFKTAVEACSGTRQQQVTQCYTVTLQQLLLNAHSCRSCDICLPHFYLFLLLNHYDITRCFQNRVHWEFKLW